MKSMFKDIHPRTDTKPFLRDVLQWKKEKKLYHGATNILKEFLDYIMEYLKPMPSS